MHKRRSEDNFVELDLLFIPVGMKFMLPVCVQGFLLTEFSQQPRIYISIVYVKCTHFYRWESMC